MFADDNERKLFVEGTTPLQKINVEQIDPHVRCHGWQCPQSKLTSGELEWINKILIALTQALRGHAAQIAAKYLQQLRNVNRSKCMTMRLQKQAIQLIEAEVAPSSVKLTEAPCEVPPQAPRSMSSISSSSSRGTKSEKSD